MSAHGTSATRIWIISSLLTPRLSPLIATEVPPVVGPLVGSITRTTGTKLVK